MRHEGVLAIAGEDGAVVCERCLVPRTIAGRMRGLLGRSGLAPGQALVIRPCQGVHTWLMRFPIDVLHVDKSGIIRRVLPELAPNRLGPVDWGSQFVVELPAGTVRRTGTVAGDRLELAESRVPA
jgi:uncharacterized membrane protein (UPF0127 family)